MASERSALLPPVADGNQVDWDGEDDTTNPLNWPSAKKWSHVVIVSLLTFLVPLSATMFAPAIESAGRDIGAQNGTMISRLLTIYVLGWTMGPLTMAPLSEIHGRWATYIYSNLLYIVFTVACAVSPNLGFLLLFHFLAGVVGSAPLSLGGGTISDLIPVQERGFALSPYMLGPVLGPSIGPLLGGFLTERWSWRIVFWVLAALSSGVTVAQIAFTSETFAVTILETKASKLRIEMNNPKFRSILENGLHRKQIWMRALVRPAKLALLSPINMWISLVSAYFNGALFLLLATFPIVLTTEYGFTTRSVGLAFVGFGLGNIAGLVAFSTTSDRFIKSRMKKGTLEAEDRLVPVIVACPLLAVGFFWYGWSAEMHAHWVVPIIAIIGHLIDSFTSHAASAIAANIVIRSIGGTLLPLAGRPLYRALHWGWGSSVLGLLPLLFTPFMTLLYVYGKSIRDRFPVLL
ncbi:major facilitator superfamily domain-containing protein [Stachybotrys elegans]|uniref:Major facilitator superfamily domain-containing protein n=1 Tax=Stachybotrys elegans TaxID=80388 RepID=A0A8K0SED8_9HYPO|nr:major facilitator superfamily domain-containing protein [Stachybotrys elegans]